jgi:hypothetical protein
MEVRTMPGNEQAPESLLTQILSEMFADLDGQEDFEGQVTELLRQLAAKDRFASKKEIVKAINWLPGAVNETAGA